MNHDNKHLSYEYAHGTHGIAIYYNGKSKSLENTPWSYSWLSWEDNQYSYWYHTTKYDISCKPFAQIMKCQINLAFFGYLSTVSNALT